MAATSAADPAREAAKARVLEEFGLTWTKMSETKGATVIDNMPQIVARLRDTSTPLDIQLALVANGIIPWMSIAPSNAIETTLLAHATDLFDYILNGVKSGDDEETTPPDTQMPGFYLASCLSRQVRMATSTKFPCQIADHALYILQDLLASGTRMKEKRPIGGIRDSNISTRTDTTKTLVKCISLDDDATATKAIPVLLKLFAMLNEWKTSPNLCRELSDALVVLARRKASLYDDYIADVVEVMRFGGADDLRAVLREACEGSVFVRVPSAREALERNVHFFVISLGYEQLCDALVLVAQRDAGALRLAAGVPGLVRDEVMIGTALAMSPARRTALLNRLLSLLTRIAVVKPDAVSRHAQGCVNAAFPNNPAALSSSSSGASGNGVVPSGHADHDNSITLTGGSGDSFVPLLKLLAATSQAGVEEAYHSLGTITRILRAVLANAGSSSKEGGHVSAESDGSKQDAYVDGDAAAAVDAGLEQPRHALSELEQAVFLGALDVAKNRCPVGDVFAEDTLAALATMADANRAAYRNLLKWNAGRWALETHVEDFLADVGDEWMEMTDGTGEGKGGLFGRGYTKFGSRAGRDGETGLSSFGAAGAQCFAAVLACLQALGRRKGAKLADGAGNAENEGAAGESDPEAGRGPSALESKEAFMQTSDEGPADALLGRSVAPSAGTKPHSRVVPWSQPTPEPSGPGPVGPLAAVVGRKGSSRIAPDKPKTASTVPVAAEAAASSPLHDAGAASALAPAAVATRPVEVVMLSSAPSTPALPRRPSITAFAQGPTLSAMPPPPSSTSTKVGGLVTAGIRLFSNNASAIKPAGRSSSPPRAPVLGSPSAKSPSSVLLTPLPLPPLDKDLDEMRERVKALEAKL